METSNQVNNLAGFSEQVEDELQEIVAQIETDFASDQNFEAKQKVWAMLALMVGGITLARAVPEGATRTELLAACRKAGDKL